ncbi:MAG: pectinesterase family protein [Ignavibacteriaceae bacterium]
MKTKFLYLMILFSNCFLYANKPGTITVAADGSGDYKTISEAVAALPVFNYGRIVILIKNGVYNEKIRIEQDYITLKGESREHTIIRYNQLREDWIKNQDAVGPAVINIHADDIVLENLTIENTQPEIGPHAFAVYGQGTRTIIVNCNVLSKGGDTVSLWDFQTGMYYHADCYFEGAVDFVCPRGWCFIKDSEFYEVKKTAALWHAGGFDKNQKFVLKNCSFDGVKDFELARHHYEAQFFFIECSFSENMSDRKIYRVTYPDEPERDRVFNWGERYYFYNSSREGGNPHWADNNLATAEGSPQPEDITPLWTFNGKWDPESKQGPAVNDYKISDSTLTLTFNEPVTVLGLPELKSGTGKVFKFSSGGENNIITFTAGADFNTKDLSGLIIINDSKMIGTIASVFEREADLDIKTNRTN